MYYNETTCMLKVKHMCKWLKSQVVSSVVIFLPTSHSKVALLSGCFNFVDSQFPIWREEMKNATN